MPFLALVLCVLIGGWRTGDGSENPISLLHNPQMPCAAVIRDDK